ncbi:hypothetical protein NEOLI_004913 [Neolecta irregularis DAH-3]|uniref:Uncharacterized protein n=1 Tax=Neolecta irregularis (strain DAH-3) TaxID=1198029 RepID=A0A1U7LSD3_NEOID|nr:hypothetical protein NEOLI_004913 [Neolecta irregularis DAH-3]|eukprot:OLL25452.1 hypothetical protein NEOLI_004913 [Neolecta irregularis DAH-3]
MDTSSAPVDPRTSPVVAMQATKEFKRLAKRGRVTIGPESETLANLINQIAHCNGRTTQIRAQMLEMFPKLKSMSDKSCKTLMNNVPAGKRLAAVLRKIERLAQRDAFEEPLSNDETSDLEVIVDMDVDTEPSTRSKKREAEWDAQSRGKSIEPPEVEFAEAQLNKSIPPGMDHVKAELTCVANILTKDGTLKPKASYAKVVRTEELPERQILCDNAEQAQTAEAFMTAIHANAMDTLTKVLEPSKFEFIGQVREKVKSLACNEYMLIKHRGWSYLEAISFIRDHLEKLNPKYANCEIQPFLKEMLMVTAPSKAEQVFMLEKLGRTTAGTMFWPDNTASQFEWTMPAKARADWAPFKMLKFTINPADRGRINFTNVQILKAIRSRFKNLRVSVYETWPKSPRRKPEEGPVQWLIRGKSDTRVNTGDTIRLTVGTVTGVITPPGVKSGCISCNSLYHIPIQCPSFFIGERLIRPRDPIIPPEAGGKARTSQSDPLRASGDLQKVAKAGVAKGNVTETGAPSGPEDVIITTLKSVL